MFTAIPFFAPTGRRGARRGEKFGHGWTRMNADGDLFLFETCLIRVYPRLSVAINLPQAIAIRVPMAEPARKERPATRFPPYVDSTRASEGDIRGSNSQMQRKKTAEGVLALYRKRTMPLHDKVIHRVWAYIFGAKMNRRV
jgi:hypothetical protein